MSTSSAYFRHSEKVPIRRSLSLSEIVVTHTELLKMLLAIYKERAFAFTTIWRLFDKYCLVKQKVSDIFSLE